MWEDRLERLEKNRSNHDTGGGEKRTARQHERGKMTAAERIACLLDKDTFQELYACRKTDASASPLGTRGIYAGDGVICGWGKINGRSVCVAADDFTVIGGTMGTVHAKKILALQDLALSRGIPIIFLNDSGGARIEEGINALTGYGEMFRRHVRSSGRILQICAIMGPCSGGACYSPALCDFIFCVEGTSNMFITGPDVVESVLGRRPDMEALGGAMMHASKSGVAHALFEDDRSCLNGIRTLLDYLPSNCDELSLEYVLEKAGSRADVMTGTAVSEKSSADPLMAENLAQRIGKRTASREDLMKIVPDNPRQGYDMHELIRAVCDYLPFFEIQKHFAPNAITGFGYLHGRVTGIIANQPMSMGGSLDVDASDKIARFIRSSSGKATGSETTDWPGYIVTNGQPPKVSLTVVASSISGVAPMVLATAISTPRMSVGSALNRFDRCSRRAFPPMDTCTICRKEFPARPGSGGRLCGSAICRAVAQVVTQSRVCAKTGVRPAARASTSRNFFIAGEVFWGNVSV